MSRELLQQALDVLDGPSTFRKSFNARAALRAALAQPEPEPVTFEQAWATYEAKGYQYGKDALEQVRFGWEIAHEFALAAPPAAPIDGFGGNLDEAFDRTASHCEGRYVSVPAPADPTMTRDELVVAAESIGMRFPAPAVPDLKHKPTVQRLMDLARKFRSAPGDLYDGAYKELQSACYEALSAAPAVPPFNPQAECSPTLTQCPRCNNPHHACDRGAAPAVREPLTDEQIDALWSSPMSADWEHREFARAIEAHHGIGGGGK